MLKYKTIKKSRKWSSYEVLNIDHALGLYPWLSWVLSDKLVVYKEPDQKWRAKIVFSPWHHLDLRRGFPTRRQAVENAILRGIPQRSACMEEVR